jgi:hypothetical protein
VKPIPEPTYSTSEVFSMALYQLDDYEGLNELAKLVSEERHRYCIADLKAISIVFDYCFDKIK